MKRILAAFLALLVLCLPAGCTQDDPPVSSGPDSYTQLLLNQPKDEEGESITLTFTMPKRMPDYVAGVDVLDMFSYEENYSEKVYKWSQETLWCDDSGTEEGEWPSWPAGFSEQITIEIPFHRSLKFYTAGRDDYDGSMKVSATFHYRDGRTVYESFDGMDYTTITLDSHGEITVEGNPYVYGDREGQSFDITAEYKGISDTVTQTLQGKMLSFYQEFRLMEGGILAMDSSEPYTVTVSEPDGAKTVTEYTGDELWQYQWGYEDGEYSILSSLGFTDMEIRNGTGESCPLGREPESGDMRIYHSYWPGPELGPGYSQIDTTAQSSFTFTVDSDFESWYAVTNKSPEEGDSILCVAGLAHGAAELHRDGTALLSGDLSDFTVYYLPPGEERVLCLKGSGGSEAKIRYFWGKLTAKGKGLNYTVTEEDLSALPFDPEDRPVLVN